MVNEKSKFKIESQAGSETITTADLKYILDVNKKAVEIYIEVDKQNEKILETFEYFKEVSEDIKDKLAVLKTNEANIEKMLGNNSDVHDDIQSELGEFKETFSSFEVHHDKMYEVVTKVEKKIEEIEKNLFRLVLLLGSTGVGLIISIVSTYLKK
jgi:predicted nuclease with TOPRIM domain